MGHSPFLESLQSDAFELDRQRLFLAFAGCIRSGQFHNGKQASSKVVEKTLRDCAQVMVSRGFRDPRRMNRHSEHLDPCFQTAFRRWRDVDPPPQPELALPVATVQWVPLVAAAHPTNPALQAMGDLITLAFFFLLRVGEYTTPSGSRRTIPLRKQDIQLWRNQTPIPSQAPAALRLQATAVTISLVNQKNGHKNAILHHTRSLDPVFCPVRAAAARLNALHDLPAATPICTWSDNGQRHQINSRQVIQALRMAVVATKLEGFPLSRVGSHSLRASGAMALKLNGKPDSLIMKLGRWTTNTFLTHIHAQIGALTAHVASAMATPPQFHNVAATT